MQSIMDYLVDNSQSAFVLGRVITDNIIMSHELVQGYGRKGISPRCMLKVDMESIWLVKVALLGQIFTCLRFPPTSVSCIMTCLNTISYSIIINGQPSAPFQARKGPRQGDPVSPSSLSWLWNISQGCWWHLKKLQISNSTLNVESWELSNLDLLMTCCFAGVILSQYNCFSNCFLKFSQASGFKTNC